MIKKIVLIIICLLLLSGCVSNTDLEKSVKNYLDKYINNDQEVIDEINYYDDLEISYSNFERYKSIISKQYRMMVYSITYSNVNSNSAVVSADIEVYDYATALEEANNYISSHKNEFKVIDDEINYKLDYLESYTKRITNSIDFMFTEIEWTTKRSTNRWKMKAIDSDDLRKLQGLS